jgi:hypothetical protein
VKFFEPVAFEIPDEWLVASGLRDFRPVSQTYRAAPDPNWPNLILPFDQVVTPVRTLGIRWFDHDRMISILSAIARDAELPPLNVHELLDRTPRPYAIRDGFHRFYASAAARFGAIPVAVLPYFDIMAG